MSELGAGVLLWCVFALLTAGTVKGILGIGVPVVSVSMLSLVIDVSMAVALLPIPIVLANLYQSLFGGQLVSTFKRFGPMILAVVVGTFAGARMLVEIDQRTLIGIVGVSVLLFAVTAYFPRHMQLGARGERWLGVPVGLLGGVLGGMTTFFGPPLIMFLFALNLQKDEFVGTISTVYLCAGVPLALGLGMFGVMGPQDYLWSTAAAVPIFLGVLTGQWMRTRISQTVFRNGLLLMMVVVGIRLIFRALA